MDIHIQIKKKHLVGFLVILCVILFGGVGYAVVSHGADQIFFDDGASLEARLGAGEQDPTVPAGIKDGISWSEVTGRPAGLDDGDDVGITVEVDPTVPAGIKDGISWSEVGSKPAFAANAVNGRVRAWELGCGTSYANRCDNGGNGWIDYADAAPWSGITGKPSSYPPSSHTHAYLPLSGGTLTGQPIVSINSAEGGSLRLENPGKGTDWVLYNMRGGYGNSFQMWNYPGGSPTQRFVITDSGEVGIGAYPDGIDLAIDDTDTGFEVDSGGTLELHSNNRVMMRVYGDALGTRFYNQWGTEMLNIGNYGTSINGNLIMTGGGYIQFPVRSSPPSECSPSQKGQAYFRTQSPEILCVCSGDGSSWKWFGTANGNEIICAE